MPGQPDPDAESNASVENPSVKPDEDGGSPAPSDGSTSGDTPPDPMEEVKGAPPADQHGSSGSGLAGPPTDPGTPVTG